jgi:hypothetical protein
MSATTPVSGTHAMECPKAYDHSKDCNCPLSANYQPPVTPTPEAIRNAIAEQSRLAAESIAEPIPMRLHCPECGELHIDVGEFATKRHHTHACQGCGMVWRPAIVATVGVQFLPGFKNETAPLAKFDAATCAKYPCKICKAEPRPDGSRHHYESCDYVHGYGIDYPIQESRHV